MHELKQRLEKLEIQHGEMRKQLNENTDLTTKVKASVENIEGFFNDFRTALRFLGYIAICFKWIASIVAGIAAVFGLVHLFKTGQLPSESK